MKKSLIAAAGVSAFAAVAMPIAGAFAVTDITDNLSVEVASTCALGSDNSGNVAGQNYTAANKTPGQLVDFGTQTTVLDINCNDTAGYKITPTFTGLKSENNDTITYSTDQTAATAGSGTWSSAYVKNGSGASTVFTNSTAVTGSSTMTDYYTITYLVGLDDDQAAGTYTGTAKYELAVNS